MGSGDQSQKTEKTVAMIGLTEEDLVRLTAIAVDRDAQDALAFIRERVLPEIRRQQNSRMKGVLDGGTGVCGERGILMCDDWLEFCSG